MNANELAAKFPELYRTEIQEMIKNRIKTNELREAAGRPVRMTAEQYAERILVGQYGFDVAPSNMRKAARLRSVAEALGASRRVLRSAQKGQF